MSSDIRLRATSEPDRGGGLSRYYYMPLPVKVIFLLAPVVAVVLFIFHWFSIPIFGKVMAGTVYYYLLYAILGFNIFMGLGASRKLNRQAPPWYDYILAFILWGVIVFFLFNADEIAYRNWDSPPNNWVFASALVIGALAIEAIALRASRRSRVQASPCVSSRTVDWDWGSAPDPMTAIRYWRWRWKRRSSASR